MKCVYVLPASHLLSVGRLQCQWHEEWATTTRSVTRQRGQWCGSVRFLQSYRAPLFRMQTGCYSQITPATSMAWKLPAILLPIITGTFERRFRDDDDGVERA